MGMFFHDDSEEYVSTFDDDYDRTDEDEFGYDYQDVKHEGRASDNFYKDEDKDDEDYYGLDEDWK